MTSNLAGDEIAQHGLQLRREATTASLLYHKSGRGEVVVEVRLMCVLLDSDSNIEISREFKEQTVEPILKVFNNHRLNCVLLFYFSVIFCVMSFLVVLMRWCTSYHSHVMSSTS